MFDKSHPFSSVQFLGIINALKTGDPVIDTVAAFLLPVALGKVAREVPRLWEAFWEFKRAESGPLYTRSIQYHSLQTMNGHSVNIDEDSCNIFLIKAIGLFLNKHIELKLEDASLELTAMDTSRMPSANASNRRNSGITTHAMLQCCRIVERPQQRQWHSVGTYDGSPVKVWMKDSINGNGRDKEEGGNSSVRKIEIKLSSSGPNSIQRFVQTAYDWYQRELRKLETNDRYFFDLRSSSRDRHSTPNFHAYKLCDDKTFQSLFNHQCKSLLELVDQFQERKGKYSVKGYPYKLGLLLSGEPGTGKTSLIKALAHYTKRHIVNVPLARILSNSELMDTMFNHYYQIPGNPQAQKLGFDQVIFVLEDIDAASDVVKKRATGKRKLLDDNVVNDLTDGSLDESIEGPFGEEDSTDESGVGSGLQKLLRKAKMKRRAQMAQSSTLPGLDRLNLSGLLNVLDGVVDTPGRMVIMTSNHPELLDPALIRPGRIDKKLRLTYMVAEDVVDMLGHYFQTSLSESQRKRVGQLLEDGLKITPAKVEQLTVEESTVDGLVRLLGNLPREKYVTTSSESSSTASEVGPRRKKPHVM